MPKMSLKLLIDTQGQKVLFAEADQKTIDFLSHILNSPMPTLLNLLYDEPKMFSCIANLFQGENSKENYETLFNPRTPIGYTCSGAHNYFSDDPNAASVCPKCSETMSVKMAYVAPPAPKVSGMYMVMDDLVVSPVLSTVSALASLSKFNLKVDFATVVEKVVDLGLYEALALLKTSLSMSNEVLTTVFLKNAGKENLKARVAGLWSNDGHTQLESTIHVKNLLSIDDVSIPRIQKVVEAGVVPRLVEFLGRDDFPLLQSAATWVLKIIACGTADHKKAVIDHGAVPRLVKLLSSPSDKLDVGEAAVCALENIASDSQECRDLVLSQGALAPLLAQLTGKHPELSTLRNAIRTIGKICGDSLEFDQVRPALSVFTELMINSTDEEVLSEACSFILSCFSDVTHDRIQAVIDSGVCLQLIRLLQHPSPNVLLPALRIVESIVCGNDTQIQYILDRPNALPHLQNLLNGNYSTEIKSDACGTISNITLGNWDQIWAVIDSGICSSLIGLLQDEENSEVKKWAARAILNVICGRGSRSQIKRLVRQGCVGPLCNLLVCPDPDVVTLCVKGLEKLVKVEPTDYVQLIVDAGGMEKLLKIENHEDSDICRTAKFIISKFPTSKRYVA